MVAFSSTMLADSTNTMTANTPMMISKKRRLTFSPIISTVVATVLSREDYTVDETKNCWWAVAEITQSHAHAKRARTRILHRGQHFVKMIDDSFKAAQQLSVSLRTKEVDALLQDTNNFHSAIDASQFEGNGRRGLEKQVSAFQHKTGRGIRAKVLLLSHRMDVSSEEVAEKYAEECLASRIYARWMGRVDYILAYVL
jgi:hypothetical protein